jgi:hypothetical protein
MVNQWSRILPVFGDIGWMESTSLPSLFSFISPRFAVAWSGVFQLWLRRRAGAILTSHRFDLVKSNGKSGIWPTWKWRTFLLIGTNRLQATVHLLWASFTFVTLKWPLRCHPRSWSLRIMNPCYQVSISVPKWARISFFQIKHGFHNDV